MHPLPVMQLLAPMLSALSPPHPCSAVLAAWLLAERIVAPGRLAWSVLHGALHPAARRPLAVVFWAVFAATVLWPLL